MPQVTGREEKERGRGEEEQCENTRDSDTPQSTQLG